METPDCVVPDPDCGEPNPACDVPNLGSDVPNVVSGDDPGSEVLELRLKVEALKQELEECKTELTRLHKQLSQSDRLQQNTEGYNQDLRTQIEQLSAELHERKKKVKDRLDAETQTEEHVWTDTDYYNYYYGGYNQEPAGGGGAHESLAPPGVQVSGVSEGTEAPGANDAQEEDTSINTITTTAEAPEAAATPMYVTSVVPAETPVTEEGDGSIADMLRATAEQAMTQTGFVFDETTGMYYDHSTGFYYDSVNQLYYDNNTGFYYYYDAESGKYQFHSRIEVSQTEAQDKTYNISDWKSRTLRQLKKTQQQLHTEKELSNNDAKLEEEIKRVEKIISKKSQESRRSKSRSKSRSQSPGRRRRESPKQRRRHRDERSRSKSRSRSRSRRGSKLRERSRERSRGRRKKKKKSRRRRKSLDRRRRNGSVNSEPEEGELTESERESSPSSKGSGRSVNEDKPDADMDQSQDVCPLWPPCVRVTVVRSPVLQVGTLFIITADFTATIGREKDMNHAIRIAEMGVSKLHAEVYFDAEQQCYMLVDQGSQNGTVINGNRILQPKTKSAPQPLTHGDEVKMGETVLSFHIHPGSDTCDGCEPGQIIAHLSKYKREEPTGTGLTREDKEALRVQELKNMKAKYGLQSNEETRALKNPRYKDRAESRRQTVGSEGVYQRDDAPASVHEEISEGNKGRKMLEKMGWKKGEGLGKEGTGIKDPIALKIRKAQSGLGAAAAVSVDDPSLTRSKNQKNWDKARERFNEACVTNVLPPGVQTTVLQPAGAQGDPTAWVKGENIQETTTEGQG